MSLIASLLIIGMATCTFSLGAEALTKPDTSLKTLPVAYFGGVSGHPRAQASYDMLAKMRIVVIEKWEGPCWDLCLANISKGLQCQPSCQGEKQMMDTLQRVKKANPSVATGYYQNTLYMWRFQSLYGEFAFHNESLRALNGSIAGLENDNGMQNVPVFSHDRPDDVERYGEWLDYLSAVGYIDGTFLDKGDVFAFQNTSTKAWQVCEGPTGSFGHRWIHACIPISATVAEAYNKGKSALLNKSIEVFTKNDGFIMAPIYPGNLRMMNVGSGKTLKPLVQRIAKAKSDRTVEYIYLTCGDDHRQSNGSDTSSQCSDRQVAMFLLVLEEGMFLGANGWSDDFSKPLGNPLANATEARKVWSRKFSSGTSVTYNESKGKAKIHWGNDATHE